MAQRPAEIGERNALSLVERRSRIAVFQFNPSRHSKPIMATLSQDLASLPPAAPQTITFDRGTEFAA